MGVHAMRIGVQVRKVFVFSIRTCYGSACNHRILVGFVCFLMFLYGSSPFVFSFLVSASPVLVCTALLLGTLLSFGETNIPGIENDEKVSTQEIASLKTEVVEDTTVFKRDDNESFTTVERYVGKGRDILESDLDEPIFAESRGIEVQEDGSLVGCMSFIDVNSRDIQFDKQLVEKVEGESNDLLELEKHREVHEEKSRINDGDVLDNLDSKGGIENLVVEDEKSPGELIDGVKEEQLGSAPGLSLTDAPREGLLGSAPGSSFTGDLKEDHLGSGPGSSLFDVFKEDHFACAPGSSLINDDQLGSALGLSWRRIEEDYGEVDGADGVESLDSGSDGAESSSPDASMADIMPMLYELHPLLESEASQPAGTLHDGSETGSETLHEGDDESVDSKADTDNQGEEGDGEDDNDGIEDEEGEGEGEDDDGEEGEKAKGEKEDESKSAIKWTEDDQKNLMDLGISELERNQRLENLIARRRARKNMRLMAEKNLIDLESSDLPYNIPPIATTRRNPFELPDDTYDNMAIPGSAPSILLPSRNPFDLPYDSNEEKPDLKGDSFQKEFSGFQHKEPVYRRNETFCIGPSVFGGSRLERQDFKWKPYFVPERFSSEEGTDYPSFQRQLSEVSESKLSSIPDSESVNSAVDEEDRNSHEQVPEQLSSEGIIYATLQRQITEISQSKASSVRDSESGSSAMDEEDKKLNDQDVPQETEVISNIDHGANQVECGRKSSEEVDSEDIKQAENRDVCHDEVVSSEDVENEHENKPSFSGTEGTSPQELKANESHLKTEPGDEFSSRSSYLSMSDLDENTPYARSEEGSTNLEQKANVIEEFGASIHTLPKESEFQYMSEVVEHREPVYDSSPQGMERFLSFTSISSETQLEISGMTSLPVLLESSEKESEVHSEDTEDSSEFEETCVSPSKANTVYKNESILREDAFAEANSSPQGMDRFLSFTSISSETQLEISGMTSLPVLVESSEKESEVHSEDTEDSSEFEETCVSPSKANTVYKNESILREVAFAEASEHNVEEVRSSGVGPNFGAEMESVVSLFSSDIGLSEDLTVCRGEHFVPDKNQVVSSSLDSEILVWVPHNPDQKLDSVASSCQITSAGSSSSAIEGQVPSMVVEHVLVQPNVSFPETETMEEQAKENVDIVQLERDDANFPSSLDKLLVGEGMTNNNRHMQHDANEAPSSNFEPGNLDDDFKDVGQEQDPPSVTVQVPMVHLSLSSSGADLIQELSSDKNETCLLEEIQSSSLEKTDSGLHQHMDGKLVSDNFGYVDMPSAEKSSSELEKQFSWSDKSPFYDDPDEPLDASTITIESIKEVNVANNESASEDKNHDVRTLNISSPLTSSSTSTLPKSPQSRSLGGEEVNKVNNGNAFEIDDEEHKTQKKSSTLISNASSTTPFESPEDQSPGGEDLKENILDRVVYADPGYVNEHFYNSVEAFEPLVNEENINEEADEIKEIDEGLLSELDTVGDFSVIEVVSESVHNEPKLMETNISSIESLRTDSIPLQTNLELPVLEAKSIQDIVLAFKQLDEGVDVDEVILPSMLKNQVVPEDNNSDNLPVVEEQSLEDIHAVLKQVSQNDLAELPKPAESNDRTAEVEKREVVSTEHIESSTDVHSDVQEDSEIATDELMHASEATSEDYSSRISDDMENIADEDQVVAPIQTQTPVILTENEKPKGT